jgi:hypothetical protein
VATSVDFEAAPGPESTLPEIGPFPLPDHPETIPDIASDTAGRPSCA